MPGDGKKLWAKHGKKDKLKNLLEKKRSPHVKPLRTQRERTISRKVV